LYRKRHRHPCADCKKPVFKAHVRCAKCSRRKMSEQLLTEPLRLRHGYTGRPEYHVWQSMKARCMNPNNAAYETYGKRGIKVCKRWMKFDNFIADMGPRPKGRHESGRARYTIDRKNNDGNYTPKNCRWATYAEQGDRRTNTALVRYRGEKRPLVVWARMLNLSYKILYQRLSRGWTPERAFAA
jgi:hypothetical protein